MLSGGKIPRKGKKRKGKDLEETSVKEPESTGRPVTFIAGLLVLVIGLLIALASVFHNILKVFVTETSWEVYGPYDWATAIIGSVVLLVGIILLMFSKVTSRAPP